jgi:hypothetical protein
MSKITVKALMRGYDGIAIRNPGDVFEMSADLVKAGAAWFAPVEAARPAPVEQPKRKHDDKPKGDA